MIYPWGLHTVGLVTGLAVLIGHLWAFGRPEDVKAHLRKFPRSRPAGTVLVVIAGLWSLILVQTMDLGEFARLRNIMSVAIVAGTFLAWRYVEEFLAVRALGMLALLVAELLLGAAFLRPETSRLLLVVLAYIWIFLGLFWVGIPWLLRDQIAWLTASAIRFKTAAALGAIYGAAILACAILVWK